MREIKFRGWDEDLKMMMPEVDISAPLQSFKWLGRVDLPIMQYTGLKDKNGKEIYEGDIGAYRDRKGNLREGFEIKWTGIMGEQGVYGYGYDISNPEKLEIIGNIYENKELLN